MTQPIPRFEDYARLPFDQLRHYGITDTNVRVHVLRTPASLPARY